MSQRQNVAVFDKELIILLRTHRLMVSSLRYEAQEKNPEQSLAVQKEKHKIISMVTAAAGSGDGAKDSSVDAQSKTRQMLVNVKTNRVLQLGSKNQQSKGSKKRQRDDGDGSGSDDGDEEEIGEEDEEELAIFGLLDTILPLQLSLEEAYVALEHGFIDLRPCGGTARSDGKLPSMLVATMKSSSSPAATSLFRFPGNDEDRERCIVFSDLWSNGYTLVDGLKFGCDWLGYSDDPLRTHADVMIKIVSWEWKSRWETMRAIELVSLVSVATKCKKTLVIASVKSLTTKEVAYIQCSRRATNLPRRFGKRFQGGVDKELVEAAMEVERIMEEERGEDSMKSNNGKDDLFVKE